jgi:hypothetical protein
MPRDWWTLLPERLDSYRLCAHVKSVLITNSQYGALKRQGLGFHEGRKPALARMVQVGFQEGRKPERCRLASK